MSDQERELAERLARMHAENPQFREIVARSAPRIHRMLAAEQAKRLLPLGVACIAVGAVAIGVTSGWVRLVGALGLVAGTAIVVMARRSVL